MNASFVFLFKCGESTSNYFRNRQLKHIVFALIILVICFWKKKTTSLWSMRKKAFPKLVHFLNWFLNWRKTSSCNPTKFNFLDATLLERTLGLKMLGVCLYTPVSEFSCLDSPLYLSGAFCQVTVLTCNWGSGERGGSDLWAFAPSFWPHLRRAGV